MPNSIRSLLTRAGDALFWLAAGLPWLMALSLASTLLFLSQARAEEAGCGGRDLMADMAARNPKALSEIEAAERETPNGNALFWRIEKPGTTPSHLLGTMHMSDPRVLTLSPAAETARRDARLMVVEIKEVLDEKKMAAVLLMHPEIAMLPDGKSLDSLMSPDEYRRFEDLAKSRGLSPRSLAHMQPWLIVGSLSVPACELRRKAAGDKVLDQKLAIEADAAGIPVEGLETPLEQGQSMAGIPLASQVTELLESLALADELPDITETMIELYRAERIGAIEPMLKAVSPEGDAAVTAEFDERIVKARNGRMAERLIPMLGQGNVFVAVGALHLPGTEGLVEKLRAAGFTVTAER